MGKDGEVREGHPAWDDVLYQRVLEAVMAGQDEVVLYGQLPKGGPVQALRRVLDEHSEVFWLSGDCALTSERGRCVLRLTRMYPEAVTARMQGELERVLAGAAAFAGEGADELARVERAYAWTCTHVRYAKRSLRWEDQMAYAALTQGEAVCAGISRAFALVLRAVGVKADVVAGGTDLRAQENHAWNRVTLDGRALHVDVTQGVGLYARAGVVGHPAYLVPEEQMRALRHMEGAGAASGGEGADETLPPVVTCASRKELRAALYEDVRGLTAPGGARMARTLRVAPGVFATQGEFEMCVRSLTSRGRERMGFRGYATYAGQTLVLWG